jgi:N-methylhydantoinase A
MTTARSRYRIGIDVGGTFTDFVLADMSSQVLHFHKEPSVPADPSLAVERGITELSALYGLAPETVELVVHGTTIGLNAIIQRRGARMALVVSAGNRDVLEIARLRLPSSYDFTEPREIPLVPRDLVFEIAARTRADGSIEQRPSPKELDLLGGRLQALNVEAVAVMLLNSYRNPVLEREVAAHLQAALPDVLVTGSADLWPEVREYERCLVAGLNAYIHPLMTRYFDRLRDRVWKQRVEAPIYITANNGGSLSLETARRRPIDTVLSGPASGVVASTRVGTGAGQPRLITFDMGGTSTDVSICKAGEPELTTATFVGDFPLMMPVVNVAAVGAGGGSILWVDEQGVLKVGPQSAGADPGPVCYGRGGREPTVTDCYLLLGILEPGRFLGGRMRLDVEAARAALDRVAARLGFEGMDRALLTAESALRVASAKMATEVTKLLATAGVDPREFSLVAYGGAGPTHANLLAEEARLSSVLVPTAPGTFCALGAILADIRRDYVRTGRHLVVPDGVRSDVPDAWPQVAEAIGELEREALAWIAQEGDLIGAHDTVVTMRVRYPQQAYELEITVPDTDRARLDAAVLTRLFHAEHERLYGFSEAASPVQVTTIRLGVIGRMTPVSLPEVPARTGPSQGSRSVWHAGRRIDARVYNRADLGAGASIMGPVIVEQPDTTVFILPGWQASVDRLGTLHLVRATPEPSADTARASTQVPLAEQVPA